MKMAKVSPVYEGKRIRKGGEGEEYEEEGRSKRARIDAKARRRNFRMNYRAPPRPVPSNAMSLIITSASVVSSSSVKNKEKENPGIMKNNEENKNHEKQNNQDDVVASVEAKESTKEVINIEDDDEQTETKEVINVDDEEKKEQKIEIETAAAETETETEKWKNGWLVGLEEWPMVWSYEEEWLWWGRAPLGLGSPSSWEYISGVGWTEMPGL